MSGRAGVQIGFAVVGSALGFMTGGVAGMVIAAGFMAVGGIVANQLFPANGTKNNDTIQYTTAIEGGVANVIFGCVRVKANQGNFDLGHMTSEDVESDGGKGGTSSSGQKIYKCPFEQFVSMGSLDGVYAIYDMQENNVLENHDVVVHTSTGDVTVRKPVPVQFFNHDMLEFSLSGENDTGGPIRFYRGSPTQTRIAAGDPFVADGKGCNYRQFAWILFMKDFKLGYTKYFPNYNFVIWRWPKPLLDDGRLAFQDVQGSYDASSPHYYSANPAAALWEVYCNKIWGKGISSDFMDVESFAKAAGFCADNHLGININLDSRVTVEDFEKVIMNCYKLRVVRDGQIYRLVNMLGFRGYVGDIQIVSENELIEDTLEFASTAMEQTKNVVQGTYIDPARNFKQGPTQAKDEANIAQRGRIEVHTVNLEPITDLAVAQRMTERILKEMSLMGATIVAEINRSKWKLQLGDLCRFALTRYGAAPGGKILVIMCRVSALQEGSSEQDSLKITLTEDFHWPRMLVSNITDVVDPYNYYDPDPTDPGTGWQQPTINIGPVNPLLVFEPPNVVTSGKKIVALLGEKPLGTVDGMKPVFSLDGATYRTFPGNRQGKFTVTGFLVNAPKMCMGDRSEGGFQVSFTNHGIGPVVASSANKVIAKADSFTDLIRANTDFIVIGDEIIQIGCLEPVENLENVWRVRNYLRGRFNTKVANHPAGTAFAYVQSIDTELGFSADSLPESARVRFRGYPISISGSVITQGATDKYIYHPENITNQRFLGRGDKPLAPMFRERVGGRIRVVPRVVGRRLPGDFFLRPPQVLTQTFLVEQLAGSDTVLPPSVPMYITPPKWAPSRLGDPDSGYYEFDRPIPVNETVTTFRIWTVENGKRSTEWLDIPV